MNCKFLFENEMEAAEFPGLLGLTTGFGDV